MIYLQLQDFEFSKYIDETEDGLICKTEDAPQWVIDEINEINEDYKKMTGVDFIKKL